MRKAYVILCGVFLLSLSACGEAEAENREASAAAAVVSEEGVEGIGDLLYRDYSDTYQLNAGSTWSISALDFDTEDYDEMYICMLDKKKGEESLITEYIGQRKVTHTVTEDGAYKVYLRAFKDGKETIVPLDEWLEVSCASRGTVIRGEGEDNRIILLK